MMNIDSLLDLVDLSAKPEPKPEDLIPADVKSRAYAAGKTAYHAARAEGDDLETAKNKSAAAFEAVIVAWQTPAAVVAAPVAPVSRPRRAAKPKPASTENLVAVAAGSVEERLGCKHDTVGEARSEKDLAAARAAGFAPAPTVYRRGTRVNETGVENARASRLEHDMKPLVVDYCRSLVAKIASEDRRTVNVAAHELRMGEDGAFALPGGMTVAPNERAFSTLVARLCYGGATYLAKCPPVLRAHNVNAWADAFAADADKEPEERSHHVPPQFTLRVRGPETEPECFAVVSPSYTPFDVDKIAEAVSLAAPDGARGTVTYDGSKARLEVMFHTDVQPEHFVAGEFFKAGVVITTDDTGLGSLVVRAVAFQNLCLNLIIIDEAATELARIRHVGSVEELAAQFKNAFAAAIRKIEHFIKTWDRACEDDVLSAIRKTETEAPATTADALPGVFNGILDAKLVNVPKRPRAEIVDDLVRCWEADESGAKELGLTRASVVNAFTRYAHECVANIDDPFAEDEIQIDAARLVWGRGDRAPAPLPYAPVVEKAKPAARAN